ncbi:hypothetical protein AB1Y20_002856 [Prymnesium parvum]|uniref:Mutator-like transposase domain-containing protein n=1 Tax=Prymnesium parvum TaxID=97485 RepID=A0AB34JAQ4_PRYPA
MARAMRGVKQREAHATGAGGAEEGGNPPETWAERLRAKRSSWKEWDERASVAEHENPSQQQTRERGRAFISGMRICSMESFYCSILPNVCCPSCHTVGTMTPFAEDEHARGLEGTFVITCMRCREPTLTWDYARPGEFHGDGKCKRRAEMRELNVRAVVGCMQSGIGPDQLEKLCGILGIPVNMDTLHEMVPSSSVEHMMI